jgi:L-arabinose isomerase
LQAGLIPIVSYESGVDAHDFGLVLNDCTVEEIECNVRSISERPIEELKKMSRSAWEFARENNTKENYAKVFRSTMERIILKEAVLRHGKNTNTMEE